MPSDIRREIEIAFNATNKTASVISQVGRDLDKLNSSVGSIAAPFASVTKIVAGLDAALLALATAGVVVTTKQFAAFDDVMRKVGGIMGSSQTEFEALTELTKGLGATTRYTAAEAAQGLEFLALAGFKFEDAMAALPEVLKLAQASATDLGTTADIVTNIMAGYGVTVEDLGPTMDVLTATFTNSNTNLMELGGAFKYVGPVAKAMGLEIEDTSAILGKLADAGYKSEQGGTALRNILLALAAPMGNTAKLMKELGVDTEELGIDLSGSANALKSLGVTVKDAEGNLRPFELIMEDLKNGLDKIGGPADRAAVLIEIFGKRGGPQMAALLSQGSESVLGLETRIRSLGGVTDKIATDMEAGMGGALRALRSAFESVSLEAGGKFADGLLVPIKSTTDVLRTLSITINDGMFDPVFDAFAGFGVDVGEALAGIAENLPEALEGVDWSGLVDSFGDLGEEIGGIFAGIDFDDPASLERAIQGIIDSLESLVDFSSGIAGVFVNVAQEVMGLIETFNGLDSETKKTMGSISGIGSVISGLTGPFGQMTAGIKGIGTALQVMAGTQVVKLVTSLVGTGGLTGALTAVSSHPLIAAGAAGVAMGTIWREMVPQVDEAAQAVLGFIDKHTGLFGVHAQQEQVRADWAAIEERTKEAGEAVEDFGAKSYRENLAIVEGMDSATDSTAALTEELRRLGVLVEEPKDVKVTADTSQAVAKFQELEVWRESTGQWETIRVPVDVSEVEAAKEAIDEIPALKRLEIETELQIAEIEAQAEVVRDALKWKAEVDIAQAEAEVKKFEAVATNINEMFAQTGAQISSLFSAWDSDTSLQEKWAIQDQIEAEQEHRAALLKMQGDLTEAQVKFLEARTAQLESGEALITVSGDGLAPHLEMIMWEILSAVQVRASQEGLNQLLLGA